MTDIIKDILNTILEDKKVIRSNFSKIEDSFEEVKEVFEAILKTCQSLSKRISTLEKFLYFEEDKNDRDNKGTTK